MKFSGVITACLVASSVVVGGLGVTGPEVEAAAPSSVDCDVPAAGASLPGPALESFEPKIPERIIDTREAEGGDGPVEAGCTLVIDMSGIGPDGLTAYALSVTAITPAAGYVTAFPCASGLPNTSSVNPRVGVATPNLVVVEPDAQNKACLFVLAGGELIVDVSGWWSDGPNRFRPIEPVRADDTREALDMKFPGGAVRSIDVAGVVVPDDAVAVTMNVAAVETTAEGFLVVFPCGIPVPLASNVNFLSGETRSVAAIVKLGDTGSAEGKVCVSASSDLHVVVDITGYFSDTGGAAPDLVLEPVSNTRVVDTRRGDVPGKRFTRETVQRFELSDVLDRPDDAVGALLNVVAVAADQEAFVTVYPCTDDVPFVASINHDRSDTANLVVTALDDDAAFCVYAERGVDVVVDLVGVYTGREGSLLNEMTLRDARTEQLVPLDQEFTVEGADYTIPCDADRTLDLRLGLAPGATAVVNRIEVRPPVDAADPDRRVRIREDGLLTIEVERESRVDTYNVRCLPTDFPRFEVESAVGAPAVDAGWYVTEVGWNDPDSGYFLAIFDERGVPLWFKRSNEVLIDTKLLSTGDLVASPITGTGFGIDADRGYYVLDLDGSVVAERGSGDPGSPADHHDYVEIPSTTGNRRAIISYPRIDGVDLTGLDLPATTGFGTCAGSVVGGSKTIVGGEILEIGGTTPGWSWEMSSYFDADESTYAQCFRNFPTANGGAGEVDPFHINSIDRVTDPGCEPNCDYVVSARHMDSVFRVDRASEDVEWILGPDTVGEPADRLTIIGDNRNGPLRPHDARMSGGILTMHDNRAGSGQPSRAVAYRIDPAAGTATLVWQIEHPEGLNNPSLGSTQITADGTVLVGWGQIDPIFSEHEIDGTELVRWTRVGSSTTPYRVVKYPVGTFDADELRESAGGAIQGPVLKAGSAPVPDPFPM